MHKFKQNTQKGDKGAQGDKISQDFMRNHEKNSRKRQKIEKNREKIKRGCGGLGRKSVLKPVE